MALWESGIGFTEPYDSILRYGHIMAAIFWMGLLWFFNVINVGFMKNTSAETKKDVYPRLMEPGMWWFRWSAMVTVIFGIILYVDVAEEAGGYGRINLALQLAVVIALVMWFNVWFMIWPRQKKIIGGWRGTNAAPGPEVAKMAARFSRFNAWMSIPVVLLMVLSSHMGGEFMPP